VPEIKRLFTFPDSFTFAGNRASVQKQIGNSVPPLLAQRVTEAIRDAC
jgi:DNA (cytosine-5)-methyltransferase 1